eukprot:TCONS_00057231-protein
MESPDLDTRKADEAAEAKDEVLDDMKCKTRPPKLSRMRSPSFEGYFASRSGAIALQTGNSVLKTTADKIGEIQNHLEHMVSILREIDALRMAVRIESKIPLKKRYLTVVSSDKDHSAIIGIDWCQGQGPTIGLVLPIHSTTYCHLDGDGGFYVSKTSTFNHIFRPVSVQTLWSARHVVERAIDYARKYKYFEGVDTDGFLDHYMQMINSDIQSITEWNEMDCESFIMTKVNLPADPDPEKEKIKKKIRTKLREIMRHLNLDEVSTKQVRDLCEKEIGFSLQNYKIYVSDQILVVMGQMDSASQILDYLYLGSEWNASDLVGLKKLGIGYVLNITREVGNFFPQHMSYYNIRVYDEESVELLKHWDHTFRFIEKAREAGSKILVHCRYGISRSASTVIAYLMKKEGWTMAHTIDYVVDKREIVQPNPGFTKQLIIYEGILNSSRNRFSRLFRPGETATTPTSPPISPERTAAEKRNAFRSIHVSEKDMEDSVDGKRGTGEVGEENNEDNNKIFTPENSMSVNYDEDSMFNQPSSDSMDASSESSSKLWESSGSQRRLRRAMTMTSGAVFFDTEIEKDGENVVVQTQPDNRGINDVIEGQTTLEDRDKPFSDVTEDALMEKVVMATQMKTELIQSVKQLNEQDNDGEKNKTQVEDSFEFNLKPSLLRRLSKASQILHLENIAKMKQRRSLNLDSPMESTPIESECEMESPSNEIQSSRVQDLTEVFTERSKRHIKGHMRRRTLDDYPARSSPDNEFGSVNLTVKCDSDGESENCTEDIHERSFNKMEVDVSDLVQFHHQIIQDKGDNILEKGGKKGTASSRLQRHQSFPSAVKMELYQQKVKIPNECDVQSLEKETESQQSQSEGPQTALESPLKDVKSIVVTFEKQKGASIELIKNDYKQRSRSLDDDSSKVESVEPRKGSSTDVDFRDSDQNESES